MLMCVGRRLLAFVPFAATGALATLLLKETQGKSLEELSGEDQDDFVRGTFATDPSSC